MTASPGHHLLVKHVRHLKAILLNPWAFLWTERGWIVRMVYQRVAHYLWLKGDTCYFNRRVPKDMQGHYKASRIIICLKTNRKDTAVRSAESIAQLRVILYLLVVYTTILPHCSHRVLQSQQWGLFLCNYFSHLNFHIIIWVCSEYLLKL